MRWSTGEIVEGSVLEKRNRGGLVRAPPDVTRSVIPWRRVCRGCSLQSGGDLPQSAGITTVLGEVGSIHIFGSLSGHMLDFPPDNNHVYVQCTCETADSYILEDTNVSSYPSLQWKLFGPVVRKQLTKLDLFCHQWMECLMSNSILDNCVTITNDYRFFVEPIWTFLQLIFSHNYLPLLYFLA